MEKVINSYECLFIVDTEKGDEAISAKVNKFTALIADNAEIIEVNEWGKRRLAYPINDKMEGYYVIVAFKSESAFPSELERLFNIDESIMRYLVVKLDFDAALRAAEKAAEQVTDQAAPVAEEAVAEEAVAEEAVAQEAVAEEAPTAEEQA